MKLFRHNQGAFSIKSLASSAPLMEFDTLRDDDERLYLSKQIYNCGFREGGFRYRFAIKAFDMASYVGEEEVGTDSPLYIELLVVSPQAAGAKEIKSALNGYGESFPKPGTKQRHEAVCEALLGCGTAAGIYSLIGGHARVFEDGWWTEPEGVDYEAELDEGVKLMQQHALFVNSMFGFFMDAPLNAIGSTGWDFVRGDITAALSKIGGNV